MCLSFALNLVSASTTLTMSYQWLITIPRRAVRIFHVGIVWTSCMVGVYILLYFLSNFSYFFPFRFLPDLTLISLFFANCVSFPWFRVFFSESLFFVFYFSFIRACLIVSFILLMIFLHAPIGTLAKAEWLLRCHSNASFRPAAYA